MLVFAFAALGRNEGMAASVHEVGCGDARTQREIDACAQTRRRAVTERLDQLVERIAARTHREAMVRTLREAQDAWKRYADMACNAEAAIYEGGTVAGSVGALCHARLAKQRIRDLEATYADLLRD